MSMLISDPSQFVIIALIVIGMAWIGTKRTSMKHIMVWALFMTFLSGMLISLHRLWPTDVVVAEFSRTGNMQLYLTWHVKYFFLDFIPWEIRTGILALAAGIPSWVIVVRFKNARWKGIAAGIVSAMLFFLPALIVSIGVQIVLMPGSWP